MTSIFLRSLVYNVMPRDAILAVARAWARSSIWLLRVVCNVRVVYRGLERISQMPLVVASKHQSMWETFALLQFFEQPLYILKRDLLWIPFFGWYLRKCGMIGVDRSAGGRALIAMARRAGEAPPALDSEPAQELQRDVRLPADVEPPEGKGQPQ